jgi:exonuclease 1
MRALKGRKIEFIVAPYESDSQMAKLFNLKMVDFAICEDSDLIIYGVPVVLKLSNEGECDYFNINEVRPENVENAFIRQFIELDKIRRTEVAVLTGTDYLPSIKGIGIKTALKYVT